MDLLVQVGRKKENAIPRVNVVLCNTAVQRVFTVAKWCETNNLTRNFFFRNQNKTATTISWPTFEIIKYNKQKYGDHFMERSHV